MKHQGKKRGGQRKIGRSKRIKDQNLSAFVRGKISAETYFKNSKK
jgi:hypothetical protein